MNDYEKLYKELLPAYQQLQQDLANAETQGFKDALALLGQEFVQNLDEIFKFYNSLNSSKRRRFVLSKNDAYAMYAKYLKWKFRND